MGWQRAPPKGRSGLFSGILKLMNIIMLHRFLTDCTLLHCNFLEKRDLSTPGCHPGVAGSCFADELLYSVHTEQLPSVYLCVGSSLFSSHMPSICEWEARAHVQEVLCCRKGGNLQPDCLYYFMKKNKGDFKLYWPDECVLSVDTYTHSNTCLAGVIPLQKSIIWSFEDFVGRLYFEPMIDKNICKHSKYGKSSTFWSGSVSEHDKSGSCLVFWHKVHVLSIYVNDQLKMITHILAKWHAHKVQQKTKKNVHRLWLCDQTVKAHWTQRESWCLRQELYTIILNILFRATCLNNYY